MERYVDILQQHAQPMQPIPTEAEPRLAALSGMRAVLFDVYGTLLISASGDVGTVAAAPAAAFVNACQAAGLELSIPGEDGAAALVDVIGQSHAESRQRGIEHPEVDIVDIWRRTIERLATQQAIAGPVQQVDYQQLAIEYEVRVNPVWPMPGVEACLDQLRTGGLPLGIVSNAQFFTPGLLSTLLNRPLEELGFDEPLCVWSFRHGQAKPGTELFQAARDSLASRGIAAGETLYIGNDMLNDMTPAQQTGFRTALFAGDQRSLRLRNGDPRVAGVEPDVIVTHWDQLNEALAF